jgi:hypothetical protein
MTKKPVVDIEEVLIYGHTVRAENSQDPMRVFWAPVARKLRILREGETEWEDVRIIHDDVKNQYVHDDRE